MNPSIGIIGLGIMGSGIATNFLKKGHTVNVWNRTLEKSKSLEKIGAVIHNTPSAVASASDIIIEITANDESSRLVWLGANGILAKPSKDKIYIASATLSISWVDELIGTCEKSGIQFLDIPVTGGRMGAESGTLTLLVGGDKNIFERFQPVLSAISTKTYYFGKVGSGMRYKLILNFLQALHIVGFAQAMRIAKSHHMDVKAVSEALVDRPGGVITAISQKRFFNDEAPVTFTIEWIIKDLTYAKQFAGNSDSTLLDDILVVYKKAAADGFSSRDWASISQILLSADIRN